MSKVKSTFKRIGYYDKNRPTIRAGGLGGTRRLGAQPFSVSAVEPPTKPLTLAVSHP